MQTSLTKFSTTRLPADHLLSGALFGGITTLGYDLTQNLDTTQTIKNVVKNAISGGVATASAINTANSLVQGRYANAALSVAIGVAGVYLAQKFIK